MRPPGSGSVHQARRVQPDGAGRRDAPAPYRSARPTRRDAESRGSPGAGAAHQAPRGAAAAGPPQPRSTPHSATRSRPASASHRWLAAGRRVEAARPLRRAEASAEASAEPPAGARPRRSAPARPAPRRHAQLPRGPDDRSLRRGARRTPSRPRRGVPAYAVPQATRSARATRSAQAPAARQPGLGRQPESRQPVLPAPRLAREERRQAQARCPASSPRTRQRRAHRLDERGDGPSAELRSALAPERARGLVPPRPGADASAPGQPPARHAPRGCASHAPIGRARATPGRRSTP